MAPRTRSSTSSLRNLAASNDDEIVVTGLSTKDTSHYSRRLIKNSSSTSPLNASSVPTPATNYSSGSEQTTPLTSYAATPATLGSTDKPNKPSTSTASEHRLEVHLRSSKPPADSHRALQQSVYAMSSKRKRDDSEDEEDDVGVGSSADARLARRLQEEEYDQASVPASAASSSRAPKKTRASNPPPPSYRGPRRRLRASEDWVESSWPPHMDAYEDEDDDEPEASTRRISTVSRKAKGKQRAPVIIDPSDEEFEDEGTPGGDIGGDDSPRNQGASDRRRRTALKSDPYEGLPSDESSYHESDSIVPEDEPSEASEEDERSQPARAAQTYRAPRRPRGATRRPDLLVIHPEMKTMWTDLEKMPILKAVRAEQPASISRQLKPFQLEGLSWMREMEKTQWKGGLLGDEMGLGKTIQAVSLIMSDWPAKQPSLVLVPPVAMMQWTAEINSYTNGVLNTLFFHGTNAKAKNLTVKDLKKYHVIVMSYNSLESMFRKQEKGFKRKDGLYKEKSIIHQTLFHRIILDEAHSIKTRSTMTAKACFALKTNYRWCLSGTPLQNRIGEFFSLIRFLNIHPFASYVCKSCPCSSLEWTVNDDNYCTKCNHTGMQHISIFNRELLNPIQKHGNRGAGAEAFRKLRILTDRLMLRRLKKDNTDSMELPVKEIYVERQFFGEEENDFANSIMTNGQRRYDTYVAQGVLLNNYANIFGLIMQMRQVADHPDLILRKNSAGGQNVLVCCVCDEPAEDAIRSKCKHDFCRSCGASYLLSSKEPDCPQCHITLSIDLEQPEIEQDEALVKKSSIINRIKMENWTSSSKIELLVHELHKLRSDNASHKSIIFSQFTTMLQLIEWRLRRAGITTVMLDGSMSPAQRQASIDYFMKNVNVECFLVSLKAGGVALNLTEASRVFIVDPWWNPAAEWQSADRCHRIGQTRPCVITRLCVEDSVESRMVLLQEKKTNMINSTINSDDSAMDSLTPEDLQFLFRGN